MSNDTSRDWEELKKLAEAATPGPWFALDKCEKVNGMRSWWFEVTQNDQYGQSLVHIQARDNMEANAAFIAAFNPATVLELIAEVERLRFEVVSVEHQHLRELIHRKQTEKELSQLKAERDRMAEALGEANTFLEEYHKFGLIIDSAVRFSERDSVNAKAIGSLILRHSQAHRRSALNTGETDAAG